MGNKSLQTSDAPITAIRGTDVYLMNRASVLALNEHPPTLRREGLLPRLSNQPDRVLQVFSPPATAMKLGRLFPPPFHGHQPSLGVTRLSEAVLEGTASWL